MIIRSQDKKKMATLDKCKATESGEVFINGAFFGNYSTEAKAIKVLDMICRKYKEPIVRANYTDNESLIYANSVFQMPQDSEV